MGFLPSVFGRSPWLLLGLALWCSAMAGGLMLLNAYAGTPGPEQPAVAAWPGLDGVALDADRPTLLLFLHPQCPCSGASLEELARLLSAHPQQVAAHALFVRPLDLPEERMHGAIENRAERIPDLTIRRDEGGAAAQRFGAETSGCAFLYSPAGDLLFCGGITAARGHAGDNAGSLALTALLRGQPPLTRSTAVYGCALLGHD